MLTFAEKLISKGDGAVVTDGTGSANDPFIISSEFFYCAYMSQNAVSGIMSAVTEYNNMRAFIGSDGETYTYNFTAHESADPTTDAALVSFSYSGASCNNGVAIDTASFNSAANSGMQIFGVTTGANSINIDGGAISSIYSRVLGSVFSGAGIVFQVKANPIFFRVLWHMK